MGDEIITRLAEAAKKWPRRDGRFTEGWPAESENAAERGAEERWLEARHGIQTSLDAAFSAIEQGPHDLVFGGDEKSKLAQLFCAWLAVRPTGIRHWWPRMDSSADESTGTAIRRESKLADWAAAILESWQIRSQPGKWRPDLTRLALVYPDDHWMKLADAIELFYARRAWLLLRDHRETEAEVWASRAQAGPAKTESLVVLARVAQKDNEPEIAVRHARAALDAWQEVARHDGEPWANAYDLCRLLLPIVVDARDGEGLVALLEMTVGCWDYVVPPLDPTFGPTLVGAVRSEWLRHEHFAARARALEYALTEWVEAEDFTAINPYLLTVWTGLAGPLLRSGDLHFADRPGHFLSSHADELPPTLHFEFGGEPKRPGSWSLAVDRDHDLKTDERVWLDIPPDPGGELPVDRAARSHVRATIRIDTRSLAPLLLAEAAVAEARRLIRPWVVPTQDPPFERLRTGLQTLDAVRTTYRYLANYVRDLDEAYTEHLIVRGYAAVTYAVEIVRACAHDSNLTVDQLLLALGDLFPSEGLQPTVRFHRPMTPQQRAARDLQEFCSQPVLETLEPDERLLLEEGLTDYYRAKDAARFDGTNAAEHRARAAATWRKCIEATTHRRLERPLSLPRKPNLRNLIDRLSQQIEFDRPTKILAGKDINSVNDLLRSLDTVRRIGNMGAHSQGGSQVLGLRQLNEMRNSIFGKRGILATLFD